MREITLGSTGITVPQNAFGALPVQRVDMDTAKVILKKAYEGGMRFFDSARAYTDSEEKLGQTFFADHYIDRKDIFIATKTMAKSPQKFKEDLDTSLSCLKTDYIDVYQFHCADKVYRPDDGTGLYECMAEAKKQGKIRHIGITAHSIDVALEAAKSGLYETVQFPFSYLASEKEHELVRVCKENNVGFIAMKGLAGGLITNSRAAMAYLMEFDNVLPIWGIQKESELSEWLSYMENTPKLEDLPEIRKFIEKERKELCGEFCRSCGYCMSACPQHILIRQCARISQMVRRAPSAFWLGEQMQAEMNKIDTCLECGACRKKCPYGLDIPALLKKNLADYRNILSGKTII